MLLESENRIAELEAILFSAGEPLEAARIADALLCDKTEVEESLEALKILLEERHSGKNSAKTTIIISHRVSTLSCANTVAVLDEGTISELGTPDELLLSGKFFARMAELQRLGEIAELKAEHEGLQPPSAKKLL